MNMRLAIGISVAAVVAAVFLFVGLKKFAGQDKRSVETIAEIEKSPWWNGTPPPGTIRDLAEKIHASPPGVFLIDRRFRLTPLTTAQAVNIKKRSAEAVIDTSMMPKSTFPAVLGEMKAAVDECLRSFGPAGNPKDNATRQ